MTSIFICNETDKDIKICYPNAISQDEDEIIEVDRIEVGHGKRIEFPIEKFMLILPVEKEKS